MRAERFFIVGAQRSGTTYLYRVCDEHPQVEMAQPVRPEPKFFLNDDLFSRGLVYYEQAYFPGKPGARLFGEKGTSYIESEKAAQRIAASYPDAKIVITLREPVQRAISNYFFSVKNGLENLPMEQAFREEESRSRDYDPARVSVSPFAYLRRGRYMDYIETYQRYFDPSRIHITLFERMVASAGPLRDLYAFLGVEANFEPPSRTEVVNASDNRSDTPLSPEIQAHLRDYFAESNQRLARRLGAPIPEWGISLT
ncbi:MAG: sulfotransferase family protein [Chloroflexota bacterium]